MQNKHYGVKQFVSEFPEKITCLGGSGDWDTEHTDRDGLSEKLGFNSPGQQIDFTFGFHGCMLWD